MVTKEKIFEQLYLSYETFKDEPIPHKNFTFLGKGSYEIPAGGRPDPDPPLVSDVVPKPLVSEGLTGRTLANYNYNPLTMLSH